MLLSYFLFPSQTCQVVIGIVALAHAFENMKQHMYNQSVLFLATQIDNQSVNQMVMVHYRFLCHYYYQTTEKVQQAQTGKALRKTSIKRALKNLNMPMLSKGCHHKKMMH